MTDERQPAPRARLEYIYDDVDFYPHQTEGVRKLSKVRSFLLADEMGLGKSLQAITVFAIDVQTGKAKRCIVVCPATLKGNWAEELEKFTSFRVMVLDGTPEKRAKQLTLFREAIDTIEPYHVLIVNYEQVAAHLEDFNALEFDMAIYDEAHTIKNHKAKRTKAVLALETQRSAMLTGSPMLNHVHELWTLLHKVNPLAFPNYYVFVHRYVVFGGYKGKVPVGIKNEAELIERLQSIMVRRLKSEVLNLPEKHFIQVKVDLTPAQRRVYNEVRNDLRLTLPNDPTPIEIENALHKFTVLKQAAATTACFDGMEDSSGKLDAAIAKWLELYDSGYKTIWFTQFRPVLRCIEERMAAATGKGTEFAQANPYFLHGDVPMGKRQDVVKDWRESANPDPIVCMLQVAGVGLNMTAARHVLMVDKLFVPKLNEQAVDRAHRIGADETLPVTILEFIARGTVEARIETILKWKSSLFGAVVDQEDFKKKLLRLLLEDDDDL
jgi:SNF2 family DNA or RNA helicase